MWWTLVRRGRMRRIGPLRPHSNIKQQGAATRAASQAGAKAKESMTDGDAVQPAAEALHRSGTATEEGREERTGLGTGCGVFDAVYTPAGA